MKILPIRSIEDIDQPIFGANLYNLAKLARLEFSILPGVVATSPDIVLSTLLKHIEKRDKEMFEQSLEIIRRELIKIPIPQELKTELKKHNIYYLNGQVFKKDIHVWLKLMELWLSEIRLRLWQGGFNKGICENLTAHAIFYSPGKYLTMNAYFDPETDDVKATLNAKISPKALHLIDTFVISANKKLFLPQVYSFIVNDEKAYLVGLAPYTQTLTTSKINDVVIPRKEQKIYQKSAIKLFLNLSAGFAYEQNIDGILIEGEDVAGFGTDCWLDNAIFKLSEAGLVNPANPVIFRLPDIKDHDIGGSLRLLNQAKTLKSSVDIFLFVRNKKNLLNIELGLPYAKSPDEYIKIKQELASRGINRYGSLKFWLEMKTPENLINLEDYLAIGVDGIILDLDALQIALGGYNIEEGEFYKKQVAALVKFVNPSFKILHSAQVKVLIKGELAVLHEILDCLVENGIYGVVANTTMEAESLPEELHFAEKRMVMKKIL